MASRRSDSLSETFRLVLLEVDHVEVAIGFQPVLMDLDGQRPQGPHQAKTTVVSRIIRCTDWREAGLM